VLTAGCVAGVAVPLAIYWLVADAQEEASQEEARTSYSWEHAIIKRTDRCKAKR
jgi:hypothetical protein